MRRPQPDRPFEVWQLHSNAPARRLGRYQTAKQADSMARAWLLKDTGRRCALYHHNNCIAYGSTTSAGMPVIDLTPEGTVFL